MPLFFWCTGYLIAENYPRGSELKAYLKDIVVKKTVSLLVPCIVFSLLIVVYAFLLNLLHSGTFNVTAFSGKLLSIVSLRGIESLWFLPCLLIAEILFLTMCAHMSVKGGLVLVCAASVTLNFLYNNNLPHGILGVFIRSTTGVVFICVGFWVNRLRKKRCVLPPLCVDILLIVLGAILSYYNDFTDIGRYQFGTVPAFYISAFLTLLGGIGLCSRLPHLQWFPFFGKKFHCGSMHK